METLPAFALYAFTTSVTPGPNNIMLTASGANFGFRRSIPHILGIQFGFAILMLVVGFGLGAAFKAEPRLQIALKIVGVAYMLWLAYKIATASSATNGDGAAAGRPMTFLQAALFQAVNVKAWMMVISAFALYGGDGQVALILLLTLMFAIIGTPSSGVWAVFGVGIRRFLADPRHLRAFNITMAVLLVASIIPMVI